MKRMKHITAFYMETLLLICVFIAVILILTRCLAVAENSRERAGQLNDAVYLARNAAEAAAGEESPQALLALLDPSGQGAAEANRLLLRYGKDLRPDPEGHLLLSICWEDQDGGLRAYEITVENAGTGQQIYGLETAVYAGEDMS